jgi:hypothetical protein
MSLILPKQPAEKIDAALDFAGRLATGESLTAVASFTATKVSDGSDATTTIFATPDPAVSGTTVVFWVQAGAHGDRYTLTFRVTTSRGQTLEGDVTLSVRNF